MKNIRMCVSCRARNSKENFLRIINFNNEPHIDQNKEHNGRAIYTCKNLSCIQKLSKNNALDRYLNIKLNQNFLIELQNHIKSNDK